MKKVMARTTTKVKANSSVGELIAVAEIKEIMLAIDAKLDVLLSNKVTPTPIATTTTTNTGPESWTEEELKEWVNDLDGVTRYCVENGGMTAQEVWSARQGEEGGR